MNLESILLAMQAYGKPRVGVYNLGWHCSIDVHVNATGASFEVRSEFGHETPTAAVSECLGRMCDIMRGFGVNVAKLEHML